MKHIGIHISSMPSSDTFTFNAVKKIIHLFQNNIFFWISSHGLYAVAIVTDAKIMLKFLFQVMITFQNSKYIRLYT